MSRGTATLISYAPALDKAPSVSFPDRTARRFPGGTRVRPQFEEFPAQQELVEVFQGHRPLAAKACLYRAGEPFGALYLVRAGALKTLLRTEDGREQVTGFYMGGDILGADGFGGDRYACDAIALEESDVSALALADLDRLVQNPPLRHSLYHCIGTLARREQEMMFVLGSMCAEERLARFLLELARRYHARGYSMSEFVLRMSRQEIASYLGLKLETISRLFSRFQGEGFLQVQGRAIKLLDLTALARLSGASG